MPTALTIAASDPCGGAGIQADLRVFASQGVVGLSAITAITIQNTTGVKAVHPLSSDILGEQLQSLLSDCPFQAIKIGLLPSAEAVQAVSQVIQWLRERTSENSSEPAVVAPSSLIPYDRGQTQGQPLQSVAGRTQGPPLQSFLIPHPLRQRADTRPAPTIILHPSSLIPHPSSPTHPSTHPSIPFVLLDPVTHSSGGYAFIDETGVRAMCEFLLPLCDLITPNISEVSVLLGRPGSLKTLEDRLSAAREIQQLGPRAVLIKGGHLDGDPEDLLLSADGATHRFSGKRVDTPHTHGTGCFLSSAIAARIVKGDALTGAVSAARRQLIEGLRHPVVQGQGRGSPDPFAGTAFVPEGRNHAHRLALLRGIYVLTDPDLQRGRTAKDIAAATLEGGANIVQLRDKRLTTPQLIQAARTLAELAVSYDRLFIVNDRVDAALASGADGVHLGPEDMHPRDARRILGWDRLIGASVGTVEEAREMAPYVSYLAVGAIFGSKTKLDAGEPVGTDRIREIHAEFPPIPLVAIGGINQENITGVAAAGAASAAVISAILQHDDITAATRRLAELFDSAQPAELRQQSKNLNHRAGECEARRGRTPGEAQRKAKARNHR